MILGKPCPRHNDVAISMIITLRAVGEIPKAANSCNHELSASNQEGRNPEKPEEVIDPHISSSGVPFDRGYDTVAVLNFSDTENPNG